MKKLSEISRGKMAEIIDFADNATKCSIARLGLAQGHVVTCIAKMGPVIIGKDHQTIAIGKNLSNKIIIKEV